MIFLSLLDHYSYHLPSTPCPETVASIFQIYPWKFRLLRFSPAQLRREYQGTWYVFFDDGVGGLLALKNVNPTFVLIFGYSPLPVA